MHGLGRDEAGGCEKDKERKCETSGVELRPKDHAADYSCPWPVGWVRNTGCDNSNVLETGDVGLMSRVKAMRSLAAGMMLALLVPLTGCPFFVCAKASCTDNTTTTGTGDYAFVTNSSSGTTYLDGFQVSGGSLVAATGFPFSLGYVPSAMAVIPSDAYLYVASDSALNSGVGDIYGYTIGTGGALTALNSGNPLEAENSIALDISPNGEWLFSLNNDDITLEEYSINSTTGLLTYFNNYSLAFPAGFTSSTSSLQTGSAMVKVAPSGDFVAVAEGLAGVETFTLDESTGAVTGASQVPAPSSTAGDYAVDIDSNNYLYVATTGEIYSYAVSTTGTISTPATSGVATGVPPFGIALIGSGRLLTGFENSSSQSIIDVFTITSGVLGSSPPQATAPTNVGALGVDSSGSYVVAAGENSSSGIQIFSIGSTTVTSIGSVASGTTTGIPVVVAMTH